MVFLTSKLNTLRQIVFKKSSAQILLYFLIILLAPVSFSTQAIAVDETSKEGKLKAAYLFNFLRFVEWPDESDGAINLCVIGNKSSYHDALLALTTQSINRQAISVSISNNENTLELDNCQLIFITDLKQKSESKILESFNSSPILTVGENPDFINNGGMINFITSKDKIYFEINMTAVKQTDIRISSKILRLAKKVIE
jgi:uncharacterized protein DUF4154